jgi:hypothetical protein
MGLADSWFQKVCKRAGRGYPVHWGNSREKCCNPGNPSPCFQRHNTNRVLFFVTVQDSRSEESLYGRNKEVCVPRL